VRILAHSGLPGCPGPASGRWSGWTRPRRHRQGGGIGLLHFASPRWNRGRHLRRSLCSAFGDPCALVRAGLAAGNASEVIQSVFPPPWPRPRVRLVEGSGGLCARVVVFRTGAGRTWPPPPWRCSRACRAGSGALSQRRPLVLTTARSRLPGDRALLAESREVSESPSPSLSWGEVRWARRCRRARGGPFVRTQRRDRRRSGRCRHL
jgi:hypothetical protein